MRTARIKEQGPACYHVISRVVDGRMAINTEEKGRFRRLMRDVEAFAGVQVLTYAALDNHIHILLHVPERREVTDKELIERLGHLYKEPQVTAVATRLGQLRKQGHEQAAEKLKAGYTYRMYDLSEFMKTLKQRFSQSYNARHGRRGTLWEGRFKSLLIQGRAGALSAVAAYIDLNAVRAGIVSDPKDYRFCGYGEAMGGSTRARTGLRAVFMAGGPAGGWQETAKWYRKLIYVRGEARGLSESGGPGRPGFSPEKVKAVLEQGGELSLDELLRCRVRYFSDGLVLGGRGYVDGVFVRHRDRFGSKRQSGARPMQGTGWGDLCTARRLRLAAVTVPAEA